VPPGRFDEATQEHILRRSDGGAALIERLGWVPSFHDYAVEQLTLSSDSPSSLVLSIRRPAHQERVTFTLFEVIDTQFEYFGQVNILVDLQLRSAPHRPERTPWCSGTPSDTDVEFSFGSGDGLSGWLRCRRFAVALEFI